MCKSISNIIFLAFVNHKIGRALDFLTEIDDFIFQNEDLDNLALTKAEWELIMQVAGWLKAFQSATT
jgi:hypothetical protein